MKELKTWLGGWWVVLSIVLGPPTLGLTWALFYGFGFEDSWRVRLITSLEGWLYGLRIFGLLLAGFPTLGYTWLLLNKYEEPCFVGLRMKYRQQK